MKKIIVISDWAGDLLNCQEFKTIVEGYQKNTSETINIGFVSSTPSTIHTSFLLAQVVEIEERYGRAQELVIFQNTDPRLQADEGIKKAEGAKFIILRLKSGILVCGPNAGNDFSLIKYKIDELFHYSDLNEGSQFRSRDLYARICAHLMDEMEDELDLEEGSTEIIPELRGNFIGHIDSFGNIKTTITHEKLKGKYDYGDILKIKINSVEKKARFVDNMFGGKLGELVIYPGSSGPKNNPYLEISVWRHFTEVDISTGLQLFNNPRPGTEIHLV